MRAIATESLAWTEVRTPEPGPGEVRLRVHATAVNRADLLQQKGLYPAPPGKSPILGLEAAGEVDALGEGVTGWSIGDRACALLAGGGYAERVVCPAGHLLPIPDGMSFAQAAALPEVLTTAFLNLYVEAGAAPGEAILLHAGGSGVGTAAIQLCRAMGNPCFVTAGSDDKIRRCVALGASDGANRKSGRWADRVAGWVGDGFDVILDPVGGAYLDDDLRSLAVGGRLVVIGLMGGRTAELDLGRLMVKRLRVIGSVLRSRSDDEKTAILDRLRRQVWPMVEDGRIAPVVDRVLPIERAAEAFAVIGSDRTFGKVVLTVG